MQEAAAETIRAAALAEQSANFGALPADGLTE